MLANPHFILEDDLFVSAGFPDAARVSSKFVILSELDELDIVGQMRFVFWGASPNPLLVHRLD